VHLLLGLIDPGVRRTEEAMADAWSDDHPLVLGAVLDLAVQVLGALPAVALDSAPRMADFARVLAAVDAVLGTDGLDVYTGLSRELAEDAAQSEPVVAAITERIIEEITGTSAELLSAITPPTDYDPRTGDPIPFRPPRGWPRTVREMTGQMRRHAPIMRELGWTVEETSKDPRARALRWRLVPPKDDDMRTSRSENDARNARTDPEPAGQDGYAGASDSASDTPLSRSVTRSQLGVASDMTSCERDRATLAPSLAPPTTL